MAPGVDTSAPFTVLGQEDSAVCGRLIATRGSASLGRAARRGVAWSAGARLVQQVLQLGGTIVLARLLTPGDYGLAAIVLTITTFSGLFADLGLGGAIVHARFATERLLASAFWLNVVVGIALTGLVAGLAIPLADLYGKPDVAGLVALSGLNFAFSLNLVPTALLERALRFDLLSVIEVTGAVVGVGVMIGCAAAGLGAVSLVWGPLAQTVVVSALALGAVRWVPRAGADRASLRQLWSFGSGMTGFSIINYWSRNVDNLVLGRFVSATSLGLYSRAYTFMVIPVQQVGGVLGRVLFPTLSGLRDDPPRLARAWLRAVQAAACLSMPIGIGVAITAPDLIVTLYGQRWEPAGPLLTLLALAVPPQVISATLGAVYQAMGRPQLLAARSLPIAAINLIAVVSCVPFGVTGVSAGLLVSIWVGALVVFPPALQMLGVSWGELLRTVRPALIGCVVMAATVLPTRLLLRPADAPVALLAEVAVGGLTYSLVLQGLLPEVTGPLLARVRARLPGRR